MITAPTTPSPPPYVFHISGSCRHRHPVPGEREDTRWTVTNPGFPRLDDVRLTTSVPRGWTLIAAPGCLRTRQTLRCDLGPLTAGRSATITVKMVAQRPLGPVVLGARTTLGLAPGQDITGPAADFEVTVVAHR